MEGWSNLLSELNAKAEATRPEQASSESEAEAPVENSVEEPIRTQKAEVPLRIPKIDLAQTKASLGSFRAKLNSKLEPSQAVAKAKKRKSQKRQLRCAINRRVTAESQDAHEERLKATALKGVVKFLECVVQAQQA